MRAISLSDRWHDAAIRAGLVHVDGHGDRSIFTADAAAERRLAAHLDALILTARGSDRASARAARRRLAAE